MIMIEWDSRMRNDHSVKILKAAIPFLDVEIGEAIDIEGLLRAVHPFAGGREKKMLDLLLQFFQMRRMMDMMSLIRQMQNMQEGGEAKEEGDPMAMIRHMMPPDMQEMAETVAAAFSAMQDVPDKQAGEGVNEPFPV